MEERSILKEKGLKATPSRIWLLRCLSSLEGPMSAEGLFALNKERDLDLSTLYRCLNAFVEVGLAKKEVGPNKENLYSLISEKECHLLVCLRCGKRVALEGCPYHQANEAIEKDTGFKVLDHNTEIYGICPDCNHAYFSQEGSTHHR